MSYRLFVIPSPKKQSLTLCVLFSENPRGFSEENIRLLFFSEEITQALKDNEE